MRQFSLEVTLTSYGKFAWSASIFISVGALLVACSPQGEDSAESERAVYQFIELQNSTAQGGYSEEDVAEFSSIAVGNARELIEQDALWYAEARVRQFGEVSIVTMTERSTPSALPKNEEIDALYWVVIDTSEVKYVQENGVESESFRGKLTLEIGLSQSGGK